MRIHLIQIDASKWDSKRLTSYLKQSSGADLTVFPECFPFGNYKAPISDSTAIKKLEEWSYKFQKSAFIAGGYVIDEDKHAKQGGKRNRAYLVHDGRVIAYYDKRIPFEENIQPGRRFKVFSWNGNTCFPLICADAYPDVDSANSKFVKRVIEAARNAGVGSSAPIVVCSYGAALKKRGWTASLRYLAKECEAPVVICNIAGRSKNKYKGDDGRMHFYGGGGSGLFGPKGKKQFEKPGIVCVDIDNLKTTWRPFVLTRN